MGGAWSGSRTIFEYYLLPELRASLHEVFLALVKTGSARDVVLQTNDRLFATVASGGIADLREVSILFSDGGATSLPAQQLTLGLTKDFPEESVFAHKVEPVGEFALVEGRSVIATGGILTHYNRPYADIHMEVREDRRRCGYGSFLVQELKRIAFERGNEPCARCDVGNIPSFRTLTRAGMRECGRILEGKIIR
jgi:GNAT superfamily N-acetyltransferase